MTCRHCAIAGYLTDESGQEWYGEDEAESIRALARAWHDQCRSKDCDCEETSRERRILPFMRALLPHRHRARHVRDVREQVEREEMP